MVRTSVDVSREVEAPPRVVFALLADPRRHAEIDGSGMVRADDGAEPITAPGQVFRMHVHHPRAGDYRTDNLVTRFEPDVEIAWRTGSIDAPPPGWEWRWRVEASDQGSLVSLTYDWSDVHDPAMHERVGGFPAVPVAALERTLDRLAEVVGGGSATS
ncbi:MAG: SRPBCC family protein [Aeromicrobium erythreum]